MVQVTDWLQIANEQCEVQRLLAWGGKRVDRGYKDGKVSIAHLIMEKAKIAHAMVEKAEIGNTMIGNANIANTMMRLPKSPVWQWKCEDRHSMKKRRTLAIPAQIVDFFLHHRARDLLLLYYQMSNLRFSILMPAIFAARIVNWQSAVNLWLGPLTSLMQY